MASQVTQEAAEANAVSRAARRKGYIAPLHGKRKFERYNTYIVAKLQRSASWANRALTDDSSGSASTLLTPPASPSVPAEVRRRHIPIVIPHPPDQDAPTYDDSVILGPDISFSSMVTVPRAPAKMSFQPANESRTSTMDSTTSVPSGSQLQGSTQNQGANSHSNLNGSQMNSGGRSRKGTQTSTWEQSSAAQTPERSKTVEGAAQSAGTAAQQATTSKATANPAASTSLSGLVCNVHRTTGREPHPLVGASTTILGDKLYVFGGRILSRTRPQLTADLYELDLIRRHWTRVETLGDTPPPRYFHTVCALGDSKLVCYGGMSPATSHVDKNGGGNASQQLSSAQDSQSEVVVLSDIYIYDVPTRTWMFVPTMDTPQGRYAHCATILPSSGIFSSSGAPHSAIHHNPASTTGNPNQGSLGVSLDGTGGAEMVVVGGQDSANHYIEQTSVFNLRSLKWTATASLGKSCGAYRSVVAPLTGIPASKLGRLSQSRSDSTEGEDQKSQDVRESGSSMLIYSNYNFLDVKLELQVRLPDGTLIEKPMRGNFSPPGLRFPNGGVIDRHFVVSGTYLTSSKQEYALWALDLKTLTWSRIDAGGNHFSHGSWNRGVLWNRRNMFVVLGNRKRSLVEDYNHRRINFTNVCLVELEAFGMYDNPRTASPMSGFVSASAPVPRSLFQSSPTHLNGQGGGRMHSAAAERLGKMALSLRELADMDFLAVDGERVPVNSAIVARRWGPYFNQLLREGATLPESTEETATLRPPPSIASRNSSITITPSIGASSTSTYTNNNGSNNKRASSATALNVGSSQNPLDPFAPPTPQTVSPLSRSRTLYLPHTHLTLQTLVHFLYTSSLPPPNHPLCTPQILCSLLQLARPYQIDGLLEAVVERLHQVLDGRNAAAVFNAAAMAAGGGSSTNTHPNGASSAHAPDSAANHHRRHDSTDRVDSDSDLEGGGAGNGGIGPSGGTTNGTSNPNHNGTSADAAEARRTQLRITTSFPANSSAAGQANGTGSRPQTATLSAAPSDDGAGGAADDQLSSASTSASTSTNTTNSEYDLFDTGLRGEREIWSGEISAVVGLQKRGLRGLMEGRRMRERGRGQAGSQGGSGNANGNGVVGGSGSGGGSGPGGAVVAATVNAGSGGGLAPAPAGAGASASAAVNSAGTPAHQQYQNHIHHRRNISRDTDNADISAHQSSSFASPAAVVPSTAGLAQVQTAGSTNAATAEGAGVGGGNNTSGATGGGGGGGAGPSIGLGIA